MKIDRRPDAEEDVHVGEKIKMRMRKRDKEVEVEVEVEGEGQEEEISQEGEGAARNLPTDEISRKMRKMKMNMLEQINQVIIVE
jgi:hypothetical protein